MTITLDVEIGDKVEFKNKLPADRRIIYEHETESSEEDSVDWSTHFGEVKGLVDCVDIQQQLVRVRGKDKNGDDYTVWIEPKYLTVYSRGMDFSG